MEDRVLVTTKNGVADVRLNRADKMNALDADMFTAIAETGVRLKHDKSLRAVVLSGEGRAFCAGLDVERMAAVASGGNLLPFAQLDQRNLAIIDELLPVDYVDHNPPLPDMPPGRDGVWQASLALACRTPLRRSAHPLPAAERWRLPGRPCPCGPCRGRPERTGGAHRGCGGGHRRP
jgi:hypothetical protein